MTRAAIGSIAGLSAPRADQPNMRGALTVEQDLKAGTLGFGWWLK
jgi:hypothetical protein